MSRRWQFLVVLVVLACTALTALPTAAKAPVAADLQMSASGGEGIVMGFTHCEPHFDHCITTVMGPCKKC